MTAHNASKPLKKGGTFLPHLVVDELMPELKDTELRVLLVVLRQTLGWRDHRGDRKHKEWISHSWLRQRTGRQSQAVSNAVDALVKLGLIQVADQSGRLLLARSERRKSRDHLTFALSGQLLKALRQVNPWLRPRSDSEYAVKSEVRKAGRIKQTEIETYKKRGKTVLDRLAHDSRVRRNGWTKATDVNSAADPDYPQSYELTVNGPSGKSYPEWGDK